MNSVEIVGLIVSILGVGSFSALFTILYMNYSNSIISEYKSGKKDIELIDEAIYDNLLKTKKRKKIIKTIKSIGFYGLMIILIPFFTLSLLNRFSGDVTMINNKGILVVATGSMSKQNEKNKYIFTENLDNQFDAYEIIVIEKVNDPSQIKKYDVISFVNDKGINTIHRIINIEYTSSGITYETRGDSNDSSDKYHPKFEDIQGKYTGVHIPVIGMFILFMQSSIGIITVFSLIYCLAMIDRFTNKIFKAQSDRLEILREVIDYKVAVEREDMNVQYLESIYYKGYEYIFNEKGFVDKREIKDSSLIEKTNSKIIKVINNEEENNVLEEGKEVK